MNKEYVTPRTVDGYEIKKSIYIGNKELLIGENMNDKDGNFYMTCYAEREFIIERYSWVIVSDSYLEIAEIFAERLKEQVEQTKQSQDKVCMDRKMITPDMCNTDIFSESLIGKILVINSKELRPEYRTDINQIIVCKSGNGANPNGHGTSIYGDYLATGERTRIDRCDIVGELKPVYFPRWAEKRMEIVNEFYKNNHSFEYGGKHFLGVGVFPPKKERDFSRTLKTDRDIDFQFRNGDEINYTYRSFMNAAKDVNSDVFRCYENGKLYVPGENELFEYTGKYVDIGDKNHPKTKPRKEFER